MRLTAYFLMFLTVAVAKTQPVRVLSGVWASGAATCDIDASPSCNRVILNVTREGNRLKVIEIISGEAGNSIAERQYVFKGALRGVGREVGTAKAAGRITVLRCRDQIERWNISEDGSLLIIDRWLGVSPKGPQQVLIFQRSNNRVE
jgi:hypothetical protein